MTIKDRVDQLGDLLIEVFHVVGLFVVGGTIVWSAVSEYLIIMQHDSGFASLKDILLFHPNFLETDISKTFVFIPFGFDLSNLYFGFTFK